MIARSVIPGEPTSKQRPRFDTARGRVYHSAQGKADEAAIAMQVKSDNPGLEPNDGDDLGVVALFHSAERRVGRDLDNLLKNVFDAYNRVVWRDDRQVVEVTAKLCYDAAEPRTEVMVYVAEERPRPKRRKRTG